MSVHPLYDEEQERLIAEHRDEGARILYLSDDCPLCGEGPLPNAWPGSNAVRCSNCGAGVWRWTGDPETAFD